MTTTTHPTKELVRAVMVQHRADRTPPMSPEQFKRELGWKMLAGARGAA
ncbi:hypothetical protein [Rugamonas sp.]|nr:hypothetical protein [Rugamonas sp.]